MITEAATTVATPAELVNALAVSPLFAEDGICFAACGSGLLRSADAAASWHPAYAALAPAAPLATTAVALSPAFASDASLFAGVEGAVLRSADTGTTWQVARLPEPAPLVTALALSPAFASDASLFAATLADGVFRSEDRGHTWHAWNFGLLDQRALCLAVSPCYADDQTLWVGTASGLFRSHNGGRSWREQTLPCGHVPVLSLALCAGGALLAGTEGAGCWVSLDQGRAWRALELPTPDGAVNALLPAEHFPAAPELLVLLDDRLLHSDNAGRSWSERGPTGVVAVAAPLGLGPDTPLLAGLAGGALARL